MRISLTRSEISQWLHQWHRTHPTHPLPAAPSSVYVCAPVCCLRVSISLLLIICALLSPRDQRRCVPTSSDSQNARAPFIIIKSRAAETLVITGCSLLFAASGPVCVPFRELAFVVTLFTWAARTRTSSSALCIYFSAKNWWIFSYTYMEYLALYRYLGYTEIVLLNYYYYSYPSTPRLL